MAEDSLRLNVTLAPEVGEKLTRVASRTHLREGTIACSLLAQAIEDANPDATRIVDLLDRIPGAWDRIEAGIEDVRAGRTIPFDSHQWTLARLEWSERALSDLDQLVLIHHLPADTRDRIERSAHPLQRFPRFQERKLAGSLTVMG